MMDSSVAEAASLEEKTRVFAENGEMETRFTPGRGAW